MAYKRLIIKNCFLIHYVLQYRFSVEAMISELCQILRNKHTCTHKHTLLSVTHVRLSGYLHKTVEPGRRGHQVRPGPAAQSAEGLAGLQRRLKALASTYLRSEVRTRPHFIMKLLNRFFSCAIAHANDKHFTAREPKRWAEAPFQNKRPSLAVCATSVTLPRPSGREERFVAPSWRSIIMYILLYSPDYFTGYPICVCFVPTIKLLQQPGLPKQVSQGSYQP